MTELAILALDVPLMPLCQYEAHISTPINIDLISHCMQHNRPILVSQLISGRELMHPQKKEQLSRIGCQARVIDFNPIALGVSIQLQGEHLYALTDINKQSQHWNAKTRHLTFNSQPIAVSVSEALTRLYETLKLHPYLSRQPFAPDIKHQDQLLNFLCMWLPLPEVLRLQLMQATNSISRAHHLFECLHQIEQQFTQ